MSETLTFVHDDGRTQGAIAGTALAVALAGDEAWRQGEPEHVTPQPTLNDLPRKELNKLAAEAGVPEPEKLQNKGAVVEAIEKAKAEAEASDDESDEDESNDGDGDGPQGD